MLWESRYVTEGRDNLSGKDVVSVSTEMEIGDLAVVPWIADSTDADYTEFNVNVVYGFKPSDRLEMYAVYNHIQTRDAGVSSNDNEISIDLSYQLGKRLHVNGSAYSFDAKGAFSNSESNVDILSAINYI